MSITVLLEILAGILLIFSALISAAALWVPPPRSHAAVRRRATSRTPVEDRPDWPGKRRLQNAQPCHSAAVPTGTTTSSGGRNLYHSAPKVPSRESVVASQPSISRCR
ncbi:hypothetical protein [Nonomuraea sp. 10N515B]|uniref:hypothetical protein n=1 Tax=Nonomuraea sp. 10N515B TaxID=3457422 RepID=UPI003FCDEB54